MAKRKLKKSYYENNQKNIRSVTNICEDEKDNILNNINSIYFRNSKLFKRKNNKEKEKENDGINKNKCDSNNLDAINIEKNKHRNKYGTGWDLENISNIIKNKCKNDHGSFEENSNNIFNKIKSKILNITIIQTITSIGICIFVFAINYLNLETVKKSYVFNKIQSEYSKNYSLIELKENIINAISNSYNFVSPIVPSKLNNKAKNAIEDLNNIISTIGVNNVQIYEENVSIYEEKVENIEYNSGVEDIISVLSTVVEEIAEENITESSNSENLENSEQVLAESTSVNILQDESSISNQDEYINAILKSGVVFAKPTNGVITSPFGPREEIFPGDGTFHHGTDIANTEGTAIYSAMEGKVISSSFQDVVGNYIEIQNGNVITRYCHLSTRLVSVGDNVKIGDKIGLMGQTGNATGPHLHFEIMYDRNRIDPEKILEL